MQLMNRTVTLRETGEVLGVILGYDEHKPGKFPTKGATGFIFVKDDVHETHPATDTELTQAFSCGFWDDKHDKPGVVVTKWLDKKGSIRILTATTAAYRFAQYNEPRPVTL